MNQRADRNRILPAAAVLIATVAVTAWSSSHAPAPAAVPRDPLTAPPTPAPDDRLEAPAAPAPEASSASGVARSVRATTPPAPDHPAPARSGMTIAIDPETGVLGPPSPQQWAELRAGIAQVARNTPDGFLEMRRADGAVGLDLRGRLQEFAVVRIGPDGKPVFGCLRPGEDSPMVADSAGAALEMQ
jgi:hypothetical protein